MSSSDPINNGNTSVSSCIIMNEAKPDHTRLKYKILSKCVDSTDCQQDKKYVETLESNDTRLIAFDHRAETGIAGQYVEFLYYLSQIARKDNELHHTSNVVASNSFCCSDGNLAASGSTDHPRHENARNVFHKIFQSSNKGDIKSINEEIKDLICMICKDEIVQHDTEENVIEYVDSLHYNFEENNFLIHMSTHVLKTSCNICGKEHAVGNSHNSEHICPDPFCRMTFPCRTRFYQHIPEHREYFKTNCWVCCRQFREHIIENYSSFKCCVCRFQSKYHYILVKHFLLQHLPRCFCDLCQNEYHADYENFHHSKFKCFVCNDIFKCEIQFKEHYEGHVKYLSEHCRVSESNAKNLLFRCPYHHSFQTSEEDRFQDHLYSDANLVFFNCETCGRRFFSEEIFIGHFEQCPAALTYKCEICETRFLTIELLHLHGLVKHLN